MAVDAQFASAFIDNTSDRDWSEVVVFGKRLRKFSLWHRLLLNTVDSPFTRQGDITTRDLRIAVGICRLKYGESRVVKPKLRPALMWARAIATALLRRRKPDGDSPLVKLLKRECDRFLEYCGTYVINPEYAIIPPDIKNQLPSIPRGRAPDEFEQVNEILQFTHWPEDYIWNLPIGKANWYRIMARRASGMDVDIIDEDERAFQASLPPEFRRDFKADTSHKNN